MPTPPSKRSLKANLLNSLARHRTDETGDTLIEIVVAVVIIGLTVVALMGVLTTSVTSSAEYRSLASVDTVLKNFADAVKSDVQLQPSRSIYTNCATSYQVASEYPTSTVVGAGVTVFGTGFPQGIVTVTVGGTPIPSSDFIPPTNPVALADGTVSATFTLPSSTYVAGNTYPVKLNSTTSATPLTVSTASPSGHATTSAVAGYRVSMAPIGWWNNATQSFQTTATESATACAANPNDNSGLQLIAIKATAPNYVTDTLQFVISNPAFSPAPGPNVAVSSSPSPQVGQPLTFTATITGSGVVAPTGQVGWSFVSGPGAPSCQQASPTNLTASGTTATTMCTITAAQAGTYQVTATYSGDANYGSSTGFGSVTVLKIAPSVTVSAPPTTVGQTLTFTATVTGFGGITPTQNVAWVFGASPGSPSCLPNPSPLGGTGNAATTTCTIGAAQAGTYQVTANYQGDGNYLATSSPLTPVTVTALTITNFSLANGTQSSNPTPVAGRMQQDDSIVVTFSSQMSVSSICSIWSGNTTNQVLNDVDVNVAPAPFPANSDVITMTSGSCNLNFGSINLGANALYVSGPIDFTASAMSYKWNAVTGASTVKIVLGLPTGQSTQRLTVSSSTAVYTPSTLMVDPWGYGVSNTGTTTGTQF